MFFHFISSLFFSSVSIGLDDLIFPARPAQQSQPYQIKEVYFYYFLFFRHQLFGSLATSPECPAPNDHF